MKSIQPLSELGLSLLACPICGSDLKFSDSKLTCLDLNCGRGFPVTGNIPFLTPEANADLGNNSEVSNERPRLKSSSFLKKAIKTITPGRSLNFVPHKNFQRFFQILMTKFESPRLLILGGAELGNGLEDLDERSGLEVLETDVYVGSRTQLICDAQFLSFKDKKFDAVIIQAVLEYISDTDRCIDEIYRVLTDDGLVYSEIPFMQQSQAFPDLKRFTLLGHNQAFYKFQEIGSGPLAAQGTALYWAWEFFLCGFAKSDRAKAVLRRIARFSAFWLKYFDYYFLAKDTADESASAYYFMGSKKKEAECTGSKLEYLNKL